MLHMTIYFSRRASRKRGAYTMLQHELEAVLKKLAIPEGIQLRAWKEADFPAIQQLSAQQGWTTPTNRPEEALLAWQHSWPALVVTQSEKVIGFVRGLTDGEVTTYIADLLVDPHYRGRGLGRLLVEVCHALDPHTRLDVISEEDAVLFYKKGGFRDLGPGMRKSYR
jgi:ribosomal protein S18 acetylase RimI-like enzyme